VKVKQKRELIGKSERTTTDKLRERRLKKRRQKARRLQKEKLEKLKAENTARHGSMKDLMDTITTSKQKNKNKTRHSVSHRHFTIFFCLFIISLLAAVFVINTPTLK